MDESWRFRSVQSNICPTCSVSHFPFCPPPPAFDLNRFAGKNRYTPELNPPFHRPVHDPTFPDYRTAPPLPSPLPPVRDQFFHEEFLERENFRKRMRVDDPPLGNFMPLQPLNRPDYNPSRVFSDDERRLSLIRDHGQPNLASFGGAQRLNKDFQMDRYFLDNQQRSIGIDHSFHGSGLGSTGRNRPMLPPEPVLNHRNHTLQAGPILPPEPVLNHWNHPSQADAYEGYRNFTAAPNPSPEPVMNHRNHPLEAGPMLPPEPVSNHRNHPPQADAYEGYRNFATAPNPQIIDKFVPQEQKEFPRGEVFVPQVGEYRREQQHVQFGNSPQLPQSYGHGNPMGNSEHYAARAPEEPLIYNSRPQVSYSSSENVSQDLYEKYRGYDYQQFHHTEDSSYIPLKQPQNAHSGSYQPASNLENYEHESSHLRYAMGHHAENKFDSYHPQGVVSQSPFELKYSLPNDFHRPFQLPTYPGVEQSDARNIDKEGGFLPIPAGSSNLSLATVMPSQGYASQKYPPLPPQPSLAVHPEPPPSHFQATSFSPVGSAVSPVPASTLATMSLPPAPTFSEPPPSSQVNFFNDTPAHTSTGFFSEGSAFIHQTASKQYSEGGGHTFSLKHYLKDKATVIDACHLFKQPHRASRPDHIVIILRGLPGSGKSYLAKALRELEVENGGSAPRIHAMDDYFMIEVEKKVEDNEGSKSSSSFRGKKQITKKVIEYCYEPEMEEAYRSSMLKAFKKTLEEGIFKFIIVDDRNLRVADFAQFWAIAKRSGYEVYLLEATYKDPTGCAARNVHGFTLDDIQKMAEQWEEAPPLYLQLDTQSLFHGDDLNEDNIQEVKEVRLEDHSTLLRWISQVKESNLSKYHVNIKRACESELGFSHSLIFPNPTKDPKAKREYIAGKFLFTVDMDMEVSDCDEEETPKAQDRKDLQMNESKASDYVPDDFANFGDRWDTEEEDLTGVKELGRSKWSKDLDEDIEKSEGAQRNPNSLSGLIQAYGKGEKSVYWGDQVDKSGFSIGAAKKRSISSLIIGSGSGYNLNSNPLPEEEDAVEAIGRSNANESKSRFVEQLRAERESFRAVFDRRRQRIGGLYGAEDE